MNKKEICIVIPIYKETLNVFEIQSVNQCIKVLSDYSLHFVCSNNLNIDFYKEKFPEIINFVFFDNFYFKDIRGYNKLLLSTHFYKTFDKFEYMLIYQTDCYVFRDELLDWANKGFDYIGGIWFENYHGDPNLGDKLWFPGNGGFSLRKIDKIIKIFSTPIYPLKSLKRLFVENQENLKLGIKVFLIGIVKVPYKFISSKNSLSYYMKTYNANEDVFFMELSLKYKKINTPPVESVLGFSWDRLPSFLFHKLGHLPFGCHAWYREDHCYENNKEFWLKHINKD
jgi:hypothetical protein